MRKNLTTGKIGQSYHTLVDGQFQWYLYVHFKKLIHYCKMGNCQLFKTARARGDDGNGGGDEGRNRDDDEETIKGSVSMDEEAHNPEEDFEEENPHNGEGPTESRPSSKSYSRHNSTSFNSSPKKVVSRDISRSNSSYGTMSRQNSSASSVHRSHGTSTGIFSQQSTTSMGWTFHQRKSSHEEVKTIFCLIKGMQVSVQQRQTQKVANRRHLAESMQKTYLVRLNQF